MNTTKAVQKKNRETQGGELQKTWSVYLQRDPRVGAPPRHVESLSESKAKNSELVLLKVYAMLHTPGSEIMTVSWIDSKTNREFEIAFDEKFPISLKFRTQTDSERVAWAKDQIQRIGGKEKLAEVFKSVFPEFRV